MEENNVNVITLTAPEGMQYTDDQIVGKTIYCIEEVKDNFRLVTDEEAAEIQKILEAKWEEQKKKWEVYYPETSVDEAPQADVDDEEEL